MLVYNLKSAQCMSHGFRRATVSQCHCSPPGRHKGPYREQRRRPERPRREIPPRRAGGPQCRCGDCGNLHRRNFGRVRSSARHLVGVERLGLHVPCIRKISCLQVLNSSERGSASSLVNHFVCYCMCELPGIPAAYKYSRECNILALNPPIFLRDWFLPCIKCAIR
jgi:hypothetical protein